MNQSEDQQDAGFVLPPPEEAQALATATTAASTTTAELPVTVNLGIDNTTSRDLLIGGGILVVLFVAYFFVRGSYANMLVRKRVPPGKANAAGWWLFIFLSSLSTAVVLAAINPVKFIAPLTMAPLAGVALVALILMLLSSRR